MKVFFKSLLKYLEIGIGNGAGSSSACLLKLRFFRFGRLSTGSNMPSTVDTMMALVNTKGLCPFLFLGKDNIVRFIVNSSPLLLYELNILCVSSPSSKVQQRIITKKITYIGCGSVFVFKKFQ